MRYQRSRSRCVRLLIFGAAACLVSPLLTADEPKLTRMTHTYKQVGDLSIKLDVHRVDDDEMRPVIFWIHGGALIMGNRQGLIPEVAERFLKAGYAIVSIDYRLAPETKLPEILEDVQNAYDFVRTKGPELFHVKTDKIAVMGNSAGGYLTLATGYRVEPRPTVLVSFYGYGDLVGSWYSEPSEFYRKLTLVTEEQARSVIGSEPIANAALGKPQRGRFYLYTRQNGLWPKAVTGIDPHTQTDMFDPFMPVKNVSKDYPPTLLIHGDKDTDVPYEQSVMMAEEFKRHGVPFEFVTIPDSGHGFAGGEKDLVSRAYDDSFAFVERYMK